MWLTTPAFAAEIPSISDTDIEQALTLGGDNRAELQAALDGCVQKPYEMQAQRFVIASLPLADLGKISAVELSANLELAMRARGEYAYGQHYDEATFAHYVLPPRVSQEPLSDWRAFMYGELKEVVRNSPTLELAAIEVNKWCGAHARFEQTQTRDQGPLATLASGNGRCEELCILLIDACRSVGIPARMAYCPWWSVQDNNHAWVEIYGSDGRWHYCGGAEPAATLDDAWFSGAVKSAPLILSPCFGLPGEDEQLSDVLGMEATVGARFCQINTTQHYRKVGILLIEVRGFEGPPDYKVKHPPKGDWMAPKSSDSLGYYANISVFNYGALRSIAKLDLFSGNATVALGAGDYVITSNAPLAKTPQLVTVREGESTYLNWGDSPAPDSMLLSFPADS
ncbi:MAG: transglutaminase-like domain-containing protein [bacterium]|nr:transglutaminase-like domain-containing protein [bacterium]